MQVRIDSAEWGVYKQLYGLGHKPKKNETPVDPVYEKYYGMFLIVTQLS